MSGRPAHFLLVEDDEDHAELIREELSDNRVANTHDWVEDGQRAIAYLRAEGEYVDRRLPDVILLDLKLPKVNGLEVLEFIKGTEHLKRIPVVILTTSRSDADVARAYDNHVNSFLVKPIDFSAFHDLIKELKFYWCAFNEPLPSGEVD